MYVHIVLFNHTQVSLSGIGSDIGSNIIIKVPNSLTNRSALFICTDGFSWPNCAASDLEKHNL